MIDITEVTDLDAVYILIIAVIYDIFYNNYLYNYLILLNY